jgi:hypothetical protein
MNTENEVKGTTVLKYDGEVIDNQNDNVDEVYNYFWVVKELMKAQILLMRKAFPSSDAWYCGSAVIGDLSNCKNVSFVFGSEEDLEWIKEDSDVFVELPYGATIDSDELD